MDLLEAEARLNDETQGLEARRDDLQRCENGIDHAESLLQKLSDELQNFGGEYTDSAVRLALGHATLAEHGAVVDKLRHLKAAVNDIEDVMGVLLRERDNAAHQLWHAEGSCNDWRRTVERLRLHEAIKGALDSGMSDDEIIKETGCSMADIRDVRSPGWYEKERREQEPRVPFHRILQRQ